MKRVVLDASPLIAFLEGKSGAAAVEELIVQAHQGKTELLMSVINWGEVYYTVWRERGRDAAVRTLSHISHLPIQMVEVTTEHARLAAEIKAEHKLPYADAYAAALAIARSAAVLTSDQDFRRVEGPIQILWLN